MKIFGISGLGADERVFKKLTLNYNINTVKWLKPHKKEELKNYIKRLSVEIDDSQPFVLIGVSFGGIVAIELSKILKPEAVIIISSICNDKEIPIIFKLIGKTRLLTFLPKQIFKPSSVIANFIFSAENKHLLNQIIKDTDLFFTKWAISQFVNWKNREVVNNLVIIHGNRDRLIPICKNEQTIQINNGGHFMVVDKADEISEIINDKLNKLTYNVT